MPVLGIGGPFFRAHDPDVPSAWYKDHPNRGAGSTCVTTIDALLDRLRAAGIAVETRAESDAPETGRFARIHDRERNAIELWEPPA